MSCAMNKNYDQLYKMKCEEYAALEAEYNEFKGNLNP